MTVNREVRVGISHSMDVRVACICGVNAAHVYSHIIFWLQGNKVRKSNQHEGRTWMYDTIHTFAEHLPYLTYKEIKNAIVELIDKGFLIKGNFNKNKFDRTSWYAVADEEELDSIQKSRRNQPEDMVSSKVPVGTMEGPEGDRGGSRQGPSTTTRDIDQREEPYNTPPPPKGEPATAGCVSSFDSSFGLSSTSAAFRSNEQQDGKTHSSRADVLIPAQQNARDGTGNAPPSPSNELPVTLSGRQKKTPLIAVSASFMEFGPHVRLTEEKYAELCSQSGTSVVDMIIEEMNDYLAATGKKPYKCYAAAIRQWIRRKNDRKSTVGESHANIRQRVTQQNTADWIKHNGSPNDNPNIMRL